MAGNIAKSFAKMNLVYWKPIITGGDVAYEAPVSFKGRYIGNATLGDGGIGSFVHSASGKRDNLVLFYMCRPEVEGFVCWETTLQALKDAQLDGLPPTELPGTHKIKEVTELVMLSAKMASLENTAFIASVM